ncbi:MAG: hypothetical protein ACI9FN_002823, partial [Saprospiraceae bacterium]
LRVELAGLEMRVCIALHAYVLIESILYNYSKHLDRKHQDYDIAQDWHLS